jgi:dCTP deaminase
MVLVDYQIRGLLADGAVENGQPELVNPASLDVRLGHTIFIENPQAERFDATYRWQEIPISDCTPEHPFWIAPGQFVLAQTIEIFHLPDTVAAQFKLKSSRGREGYQHALAGWCDPGWNNSALTMELKNLSQRFPLPLYPGLKIGQMVFERVDRPSACYKTTGRYNGDRVVTASRG